jgi:DNA invertase Pin-like site-specific DNA recombinase
MAKNKPNRKVILAVAYCRKSTNEERTEKSIADQTARIGKLTPADAGSVYLTSHCYDRDKGVPGWKRGAARPDFDRLVRELPETGAKAILVDDMDRFSRADQFEVMHLVQELREKHGIRYIHAANQGCIDLIKDQFAATKIAMWAMAGHEFSTRLSRRVAHARLDAAKRGLRSGGAAPYGMVNDGKGGLLRGDSAHIAIVRWIFDQWVNKGKSMNWIAADLNLRGVPARKGGQWYVAKVKDVLQRREYRGDFTYNNRKSGEFHIVNEKQEVVPISNYHDDKPKPWKLTDAGLIVKRGAFESIVQPEVFDAAQERFKQLSLKGSRRPRADGYPLSRILYCDHCGKPMYGCQPTGRSYRVYRCSTPAKSGCGTCGTYEVREKLILPFVMRLLGEELGGAIGKMLTYPPKELVEPDAGRLEQRKPVEEQRDKLAKRIAVNMDALLDTEDKRTRKDLEQRISAMRDDLAKLEAQLAAVPRTTKDSIELRKALGAWWRDFEHRAVTVPVNGDLGPVSFSWQDPFTDEQAMLLEPRVVNEALHALGCEVRLRWATEGITLSNGKRRNRYTLAKGRFRLGQRSGNLALPSAATFHTAQAAVKCNCSFAASRRDSRKGRGSRRRSA